MGVGQKAGRGEVGGDDVIRLVVIFNIRSFQINGNMFKELSKTLKRQPNYNVYESDKRLVIIGNGQVYIDDSDYIKLFVDKSLEFLNLAF